MKNTTVIRAPKSLDDMLKEMQKDFEKQNIIISKSKLVYMLGAKYQGKKIRLIKKKNKKRVEEIETDFF